MQLSGAEKLQERVTRDRDVGWTVPAVTTRCGELLDDRKILGVWCARRTSEGTLGPYPPPAAQPEINQVFEIISVLTPAPAFAADVMCHFGAMACRENAILRGNQQKGRARCFCKLLEFQQNSGLGDFARSGNRNQKRAGRAWT